MLLAAILATLSLSALLLVAVLVKRADRQARRAATCCGGAYRGNWYTADQQAADRAVVIKDRE
jgi:hypothetical protein